jgi:glutamate-1-semialdehyde 2,1-aminomutase
MLDQEVSAIEREYTRLTPTSASLMTRASESMPHGITRTLSWFRPYPVVFDHGKGSNLYDVDDNRYVDLFSNGLSLMHGHNYGPIREALEVALARGTAWPGTSDAQIQFAELLCSRVPGAEQVRFTNTGTEATMLGVKLARHVTGKQLILKAWHGYHGSYDDLEVGLLGQGEMPGRVALATFGDISTYKAQFERHAGEIAAVIVEPVQYTGVVTEPPDGFLAELQKLTADAGALFVMDDCLMFRLAEGGTVERYGLEPADITCLGKFIGGGLPVGAIGASAEMMATFHPSPDAEGAMYHGGSFNGNVLGMVAGDVAVRHLTAAAIERLDGVADALRARIQAAAEERGVSVQTKGVGSAFGLYVLDGPGGEIDWPATSMLQLASATHGVYYGSGGEFGLNTALTEDDVDRAVAGISSALSDLAGS